MKKALPIFLLFFILQTYGQYNEGAPWMNSIQKKSINTKKTTIDEISDSFNNYWRDKDYNKKGSGYKPYKRWENHWRNYIQKDGTIATPEIIWNAWEQKQSLAKNSTSNWESIGPYTTNVKTGQGRVNTFIIDPNNPNTYYVGAPSGGIWKSTDTGNNWTPLSDNIPQIGVSGIAIDHNNSNIIYIATGDDDAFDTYSVGVLKSTNGGISWENTGLDFSSTSSISNEIYIHPSNSNIIWVSTGAGFYKSTDAGVSWSKKISNNIKDFKLKPGDPNIIYAVSKSKFYKSTDAGDTFTVITIGLPTSSGRFAVDVSPENPEIVYVLSAKTDNSFQGLYKSTNSGDTFNKTNEEDDIFGGSTQAWYDMALTVSPNNANLVFVGVLDIWSSSDGGNNFSQKNHWYDTSDPSYTHADIHFLRYFNNKLYAGTDGGIYESSDDANSFNDLTETLNISQYYKISTAKNSTSFIAGGLQDNGGFAYSNNNWHKYHGGDGMDNVVDPNNDNIFYGFSQYGGNLNITYNGGFSEGGTVTSAPADETGAGDSGGKWVTPLVSTNKGDLYAGYSKLYKLNDNSWEAISSNVFGGDLSNIDIASSNNQIIFTSRSNKLFKSNDGGLTFTEDSFVFPNFISSISINNQNSDIIYISIGGIPGSIFKSIDGGDNWDDITKNLPNEPKLVIKHQNQSLANDLFLGTSLGVYHINDDLTEWEVYDTNLPNVPIYDIEINTVDQKIIVGTYGRGVWQSPIEVIKADHDISLFKINSNNSTQCNGFTPKITVKNNGLNSINSVDINYFIDDMPFSYTHNGNISSNETKEIELPNNNSVTLGEHSLKMETLINNDTFSNNNILFANFTTNISGEGKYINTFGDVNEDEWFSNTLGGTEDIWKKDISIVTKFNSVLTNYYTTDPRGNYPDEITSYLISPCYDLTQLENPILKFDMVFDIELEWDVLYMEYSTDSGGTWSILGNANDPNWYNSSFIDPARPITVGKQWTGTDSTVKEYSYNLSAFKNENTIMFRFVFASDWGTNAEGVGIDNFTLDASAILAVDNSYLNEFKVYPNPSSDVFNIQRQNSNEMKISVYDVTGKLIFKDDNILKEYYSLNLSNVSKGLYFLKITEGNKHLTKRLMVE